MYKDSSVSTPAKKGLKLLNVSEQSFVYMYTLKLFVVEEIRDVLKINKRTLGCVAGVIIYINVLICKEFFMFLVETQLQFFSLHGGVVCRETVILEMH